MGLSGRFMFKIRIDITGGSISIRKSWPHRPFLLRFPPFLWKGVKLQNASTAIGRTDTIQAMLLPWIETGLMREEPDVDK